MKSNRKPISQFYNTMLRILGISLLFCASLMILMATQLYKNEKFKELENTSSIFIENLASDFLENHEINGSINGVQYTDFASNYEFIPYVYSISGQCIFSPDGSDTPLTEYLKKNITSDGYIDFDAHRISSQEPYILYGKVFTISAGDTGLDDDTQLYVVTYSSTSSLTLFNYKIILSALVAFAVCFIPCALIIRTITKSSARNYVKLAEIVEQYAKNDFSERLDFPESENLQKLSLHINTLADNVKNADDASKTFISNVSHELRTPLTTIGGFVGGILDGTIAKSKQNEYLILVSKEISRLTMVIRSMLNMTRFESGTMRPNFAKCNLNDIVIQTVLMFEKRIEAKKIDIEFPETETITAEVDADLIQQVIFNLVENAVKFVNEGGKISFDFAVNKDIHSAYIGIKNTGEGLKEEEMEKVFDRFYKTDASRGKDITGLGIGLALSKKIIQLHNGEIIVKSIYGEYTEFAMLLPLQQNDRKEN